MKYNLYVFFVAIMLYIAEEEHESYECEIHSEKLIEI